MIDGKLVLAPIFKRSEEQLWDDVDLIFNKYNKNLDDVLSKEEIRPYLIHEIGASKEEEINEEALLSLYAQIDIKNRGEVDKDMMYDFLSKR